MQVPKVRVVSFGRLSAQFYPVVDMVWQPLGRTHSLSVDPRVSKTLLSTLKCEPPDMVVQLLSQFSP